MQCMLGASVASARVSVLAALRGGAIASLSRSGLRMLLTMGSVAFAAALLALARGLSRANASLKTPIEEGPFPSRWEALRRQYKQAKWPSPVAGGAAAAHSRGARQEAAIKILTNHKNVRRPEHWGRRTAVRRPRWQLVRSAAAVSAQGAEICDSPNPKK